MNRANKARGTGLHHMVHHHQDLAAATRRLHGRHQAPARGQLGQPGLGQVFATGGSDDGVIRAGAGMAQASITIDQADLAQQTQTLQMALGLVVQGAQALDAHHLARQRGQHRGLVTAAGANLQHPAQLARAAGGGTGH